MKTYTLTVSTDDHCYCGVSFQADTMADLTELVDIPTRRVLSALTVLEIDQYVVQHAGKHYTRAVTLTE